jgi:SAM-dependent methyltransferase
VAEFPGGLSRRDTFVEIMKRGIWGSAGNESGGGSTIDYTAKARDIVLHVVEQYQVRSLLDVACGDFSWMPLVLERIRGEFRYVGGDIVPALVERHRQSHPAHEFLVLDCVCDDLPACDLVLCRDMLQHLPVADIKAALRNISRSGARFLLATTHLRQVGWRNRRDIRVGKCNDRNLLLGPFNLGNPVAIYSEEDAGNKFLGLWVLPLRRHDGSSL